MDVHALRIIIDRFIAVFLGSAPDSGPRFTRMTRHCSGQFSSSKQKFQTVGLIPDSSEPIGKRRAGTCVYPAACRGGSIRTSHRYISFFPHLDAWSSSGVIQS